MDITIPFILSLVMYVCGIVVGRNWDRYVEE